jgi:hypothetical protein
MISARQFVRSALILCVSFRSLSLDVPHYISLSPPPDPIPPAYFGLHIHRAATTTSWPSVPFRSWRLWDAAVNWLKLEPGRGVWQFATLDRCVALAEQHQVQVILTLGRTPQWASARPDEMAGSRRNPAPGGAAPPKNLSDWQNYVRIMVTRYKGRIEAYEIWNEPNLMNYYSGSPEQMITLAREAYTIIKEVDPAALVVAPSAVGPTGAAWLEQYFRLGGASYADVIGYHFYMGAAEPELMLDRIREVQRVMAKSNINKPLWDTENGCCFPVPKSFTSEREKSAYVARLYILDWAAGVRRLYWYSWDNQELSIAFTESDDARARPAALAYAEIQRWLVGSRVRSCYQDNRGTWICQLTRDSGYRGWIVWNPDSRVQFDVPEDWKVNICQQLNGEERNLDRHTRVDVDFSPVLLEGRERAGASPSH